MGGGGAMMQTSGRPCCSYLLRQSGQESTVRSFGCLCYQQGRLVRVEGAKAAGTGGVGGGESMPGPYVLSADRKKKKRGGDVGKGGRRRKVKE